MAHIPWTALRFAPRFILSFRSCRLIGAFIRAPLPSLLENVFAQGSFAREDITPRHRSYEPMRESSWLSPLFRHQPYKRCPCRLSHPRLLKRTFPTLLRPSFLKCHALYAGGSPGARDQFFPDDIGLRPVQQGLGDPGTISPTASGEGDFRHGRHSLMLWPSSLLAPLTVRYLTT